MTEIGIIDALIIVLIGIIEGITEWLPVSSTGHMLIFDQFVPFKATPAFKEMFFVVIQLGAILAVVTVFFKKMLPFGIEKKAKISETNAPITVGNGKKLYLKNDVIMMWLKVVVACIPSAVIGVLFDDFLEKTLSSPLLIAAMLVLYGVGFIVIEKLRKGSTPKCNALADITWLQALLIGGFQVLSLIPGTSRSGATIIGALIIGVSRTAAAEFTFFLAVPTMLGASLLKLLKFGLAFTSAELIAVLLGMAVAYAVSLIAIKFLMDFVKKHDFSVFGWYRIALGAVVILVTLLV